MHQIRRATVYFYVCVSAVLAAIALAMVAYSIVQLITAAATGVGLRDALLAAVGLVVVSLAVFDVAKYLIEENVIRDQELRVPAEARYTLTKFMTIIIIATSLESLIFIFGSGRDNVGNLVYPALLLVAAVFAIVGLGLYQRLSLTVERREPKPASKA